MEKYIESTDGYIVFEDGGESLMTYGASEKWFPTYDTAIKYALNIVNERVKEIKEVLCFNSVIVYEGSKELLHKQHSCPCGRVVFHWTNYKMRR